MKKRKPRNYTLRTRKSNFISILRTTPPKTVCPNFFILAHANGCAFAPKCSYCYLKASLSHMKEDQVYANTDRMLAEVARWLKRDKLESYVLNTGNLSDSLCFEEHRPLVSGLVNLFREQAAGRPHTLLLVTKGGTMECAPLFEMEPCDRVIVSFSVNHPEAARKHEAGAPATADRMAAAAGLRDRGWRIRLRIDPMIMGFNYRAFGREVAAFRPERVTLGSLRADPLLLRKIKLDIFDALDAPADPKGLARYPLADRVTLYRQAAGPILKVCGVALCEETKEVWEAVGLDPAIPACNCGL